jgi:hypothetical protein
VYRLEALRHSLRNPCDCWGIMANVRWKERSREFVLLHAQILIKNLRIIYESSPKFWCVENPPGKMRRFLGEPRWQFDPSEFGENYHKKTLLWGKFNFPERPIFQEEQAIIKDYIRQGRVKNRKETRAITPPGFANAFFEANQ